MVAITNSQIADVEAVFLTDLKGLEVVWQDMKATTEGSAERLELTQGIFQNLVKLESLLKMR